MSMNDDTQPQVMTFEPEIMLPTAGEMAPAVAAEINQQVATARRYPRRRDKEISDEIVGRATLNGDIAAECMYSLKRGDKNISGPSIRFAEIVRASYGNIRVAARFVRLDLDDPTRGAVIVEAAAIDLQSNNAECIPVRRSVMTSGKAGRKAQVFSADMINMTVNAGSSLARRNAILAVVPKSVWIDGWQRVVKVLQGDVKTLAARRRELIEAFARVGVTAERVFEALDVKSIEDITIEHIPTMMGFATAIKEGEAPDQVFGRAAGEATHATTDNPLRDRPDDVAPNRQQQRQADAREAGADERTGEMPHEDRGEPAGELAPEMALEATPKADPAPASTKATEGGDKQPAKAAKAETVKARAIEDLAAITTATDYREHAMTWIGAATELKAATAQWNAERAKRSELDLAEDILVEISGAYQAKIKTLKPAP